MLIQLLFVMLAAVNIAAYFLMWKDKVRAVRHDFVPKPATIIPIE